jgi:acyl transferase domain-containing protein/acyl carrier protein
MAESNVSQYPTHAIAIVGMAGRFPGARDLDQFWHNVRDGVESLDNLSEADLDAAGVVPVLRNDPNFVRKATCVENADLFDSAFFGFSPREADVIDPQQRVFLECAWEAMEHAGYVPEASEDRVVGVYAGASINTYLLAQILRNKEVIDKVGAYQIMLANDKDFLCTRVSYKLDLRGPSMTVQTACSTSLVAVEVACRALNRHQCDMALAGGVSINFPQRSGYLYEDGMIFSPDGHCRPFDVEARGTRAGAGAGIVVLKRLADALTDRDTIYAIVLGAAINNDGSGKAGYTAPSVDGQVEVIAMAQALAGVDPRTISFIETHGTATPLGDPIEIAALTEVFRASTSDVGFCRLGALKANLGHLDAAAGVAGLIKAVLALTHREIPPLVNFRAPNPQLELESSPFAASAQGQAWISDGAPRRAGVSSFGIGGTNAHVVLEEAPAASHGTSPHDSHLIVLSAKTASALEQSALRLAAHLETYPVTSLTDVEWTLQGGRKHFAHRRILVASDAAQAATMLREPPRSPNLTSVHDGGVRPVAFLFSGQGSQHVRMGHEVYRSERVYREALDRCAAIFEPHLGVDIRRVVAGDLGEEAITETRLAQPVLFSTAYALAHLWMHWGITPAAMLGHSIGEYVAAHLAGVFSLEHAIAVVAARARLMQELPPGRMAAVQLSPEELRGRLGNDVEIAAVNASALCTVSGTTAAIEELVKALEADGIGVRPLHTSHAFHSAMMEPMLEPFTAALRSVLFSAPTIPYISNVSGTWITPEEATSPDYYATHLRRPVQFEAGIRRLAEDPALFFLEVGPGNALKTMARTCLSKDRGRHTASSLPHPQEQRPETQVLHESLGRLWLSGAAVDWRGFHADSTPRRIPLPTYPFERKRHWVEAVVDQPSSTPTDVRIAAKVDDWFYVPSWIRDVAVASTPCQVQGIWLVLGQPGTLLTELMAGLRDAGTSPIFVRPAHSFRRVDESTFDVRPAVADDISALVKEIGGRQETVAGAIVHWNSIREGISPDGDLAGYSALVALAEGVQDVASQSSFRVIVATEGGESVLDEPVINPEAALARGPVLTLPMELPGLNMRAVDLEMVDGRVDPKRAVRALLDEASSVDAQPFVARRGSRRWLRRFERVRLPEAAPGSLPLKSGGLYLITGGMGGIGLTLARWLASEMSARVLLTGRSALPPPEEWDGLLAQGALDQRRRSIIAELRQMEQAGGAVLTACADAADAAAMRHAIDAARSRWGEIDGVIHAAGMGGSGSIAFLKNANDVRKVFAPKISGLRVLTEILGDRPLDFVVLMSSINAVVSAPGLSDYSAANAFLDAFAESTMRPHGWKRIVALDWGAWQDVGMAARRVVPPSQREEWEAYLASSIKPAAGLDAFARALASGQKRLIITPFDFSAALEGTHADVDTRTIGQRATAPQVRAIRISQPLSDVRSEGEKLSPQLARESGDLAVALVRAHPAVADAAVVQRKSGRGSSRQVVYIVYHPGEELTASEMRSELKGKVPNDQIPSIVVTVDTLPRKGDGTLDIGSLPNPFEDAVTQPENDPPASGMEKLIAEIWQDVLGADGITSEDNFFELGGDSLQSVRVTAAVMKNTGYRMDPRTLFFQNLRQLAAGIEARVAR